MEDKELQGDMNDLAGMVAHQGFIQIFKSTADLDSSTAVVAAVSFFTQVLFLMTNEFRAGLMSILDEISVLMNTTNNPDEFMNKLKDFDLKSRLKALVE